MKEAIDGGSQEGVIFDPFVAGRRVPRARQEEKKARQIGAHPQLWKTRPPSLSTAPSCHNHVELRCCYFQRIRYVPFDTTLKLS